MTKKQQIVSIIQSQQKLISAGEVIEKMEAKGVKVNKTTVYRHLGKLEKEKSIKAVNLGDNEARYEAIDKALPHHHHLICEGCNKTYHIAINESFIDSQLSKYGFKPRHHLLEVFGLCERCQK